MFPESENCVLMGVKKIFWIPSLRPNFKMIKKAILKETEHGISRTSMISGSGPCVCLVPVAVLNYWPNTVKNCIECAACK